MIYNVYPRLTVMRTHVGVNQEKQITKAKIKISAAEMKGPLHGAQRNDLRYMQKRRHIEIP
jgi:hypothetical protein